MTPADPSDSTMTTERCSATDRITWTKTHTHHHHGTNNKRLLETATGRYKKMVTKKRDDHYTGQIPKVAGILSDVRC